ncbi:hypothetical protein HDU93_008295 [Gonapodya sp. JEL0774]|nr:hypothetical protein HDU93_008295 [Gonapodya sp. JEL0774]
MEELAGGWRVSTEGEESSESQCDELSADKEQGVAGEWRDLRRKSEGWSFNDTSSSGKGRKLGKEGFETTWIEPGAHDLTDDASPMVHATLERVTLVRDSLTGPTSLRIKTFGLSLTGEVGSNRSGRGVWYDDDGDDDDDSVAGAGDFWAPQTWQDMTPLDETASEESEKVNWDIVARRLSHNFNGADEGENLPIAETGDDGDISSDGDPSTPRASPAPYPLPLPLPYETNVQVGSTQEARWTPLSAPSSPALISLASSSSSVLSSSGRGGIPSSKSVVSEPRRFSNYGPPDPPILAPAPVRVPPFVAAMVRIANARARKLKESPKVQKVGPSEPRMRVVDLRVSVTGGVAPSDHKRSTTGNDPTVTSTEQKDIVALNATSDTFPANATPRTQRRIRKVPSWTEGLGASRAVSPAIPGEVGETPGPDGTIVTSEAWAAVEELTMGLEAEVSVDGTKESGYGDGW